MTQQTRWHYRFANFSRAYSLLREALEDSNIPQKCDLVAYETIRYPPFKLHINTFGITIYRKRPHCAP